MREGARVAKEGIEPSIRRAEVVLDELAVGRAKIENSQTEEGKKAIAAIDEISQKAKELTAFYEQVSQYMAAPQSQALLVLGEQIQSSAEFLKSKGFKLDE